MPTSIDHRDGKRSRTCSATRSAKHARRTAGARNQIQARLARRISLQTLATYELGTRQCSVARLVELCRAMNVFPHDLLARVYERTAHRGGNGRLLVDLDGALRDEQPELLPLRRWARQRLDQVGARQPHAVTLDLPALDRLAELCGVATVDLINRLRRLGTPEPGQSPPCAQPEGVPVGAVPATRRVGGRIRAYDVRRHRP